MQIRPPIHVRRVCAEEHIGAIAANAAYDSDLSIRHYSQQLEMLQKNLGFTAFKIPLVQKIEPERSVLGK